MTAQEAYDKTEKLLQAYSEGDLLGGNPMQYIEQYAKEYHETMVKKSVCEHEYIIDSNCKSLTCIKCNARKYVDETVGKEINKFFKMKPLNKAERRILFVKDKLIPISEFNNWYLKQKKYMGKDWRKWIVIKGEECLMFSPIKISKKRAVELSVAFKLYEKMETGNLYARS